MKTLKLVLILFLWFLVVAQAMAGERKPIVAVFDAESKGSGLSRDFLTRMTDYISSRLVASGAFEVIPRKQLKARLLSQKRNSYKTCYDQECQIEIGRELAAEKTLSTDILKLGSKCIVTSTLYDLRRASAENAATADGGCNEDAIVKTLEQVADALATKMNSKAQEKTTINPTAPLIEAKATTKLQVTVDIRSNPDEAELLIDDRLAGHTPTKVDLEKDKTYRMVLKKDGYKTIDKTELISDSKTLEYSFEPAASGSKDQRYATDYFGFKLGGGMTNQNNGAVEIGLSYLGLKWKYFNITCLEVIGGYGGVGSIRYLVGGARPGFTFALGDRGQHQIRLGLGIGYGGIEFVRNTLFSYQGTTEVRGFMLWPTISYIYQTMGSLSLGATFHSLFGTTGPLDCYYKTCDRTLDPVIHSLSFEMNWASSPKAVGVSGEDPNSEQQIQNPDRPFYVRADFSGLTMMGRLLETRLSFGYTLFPFLEVEAGLAWSVGVEADFIQLQLGPRLLFGNGTHYFVSSAKLSVGFDQSLFGKREGDGLDGMKGNPVFLDLMLAAYELRFSFGLSLTLGAGLSVGLGGGKFMDNESNVNSNSDVGAMVQAGLGYRF